MKNFFGEKLIVIMGPTSSGKSSLAIEMAKEWDGEIISADSRQVYRGMDIGTGKVKKDKKRILSNFEFQMKREIKNSNLNKNSKLKIRNFAPKSPHYFSEGIPHHLLDIANPNDDYNVSHFVRDARAAIEDILNRKKLPIICGGTGFWIQALVENQNIPSIPPDHALRESLSQKTPEELFEMLQKLDPARAEKIDRKNPRRLIRAIEIAKNPSNKQPANQTTRQPDNQLLLALCPPKNILDAKIKARLDARFDEGMIEEVARLRSEGVSWERLDSFGLEYRWISHFLRNMISEQEMKEKLFFDSIHYAKRQMTWIRRWHKQNAPLHIIETPEEAMELAEEFLEKEYCPKTLSGS